MGSYVLTADDVTAVVFTRALWNAAVEAAEPDADQLVLLQVLHRSTDNRGFYAVVDTVEIPVGEGDYLVVRDTLIEEVWDAAEFAAKWEAAP